MTLKATKIFWKIRTDLNVFEKIGLVPSKFRNIQKVSKKIQKKFKNSKNSRIFTKVLKDSKDLNEFGKI